MGKTLLSSKTFWVAVIQTVVGAITIFATAYPTVGELLIVKSIFDVVLRMITTEPIK